MTTAAVYNQYWSTGGGGETFCGGIAQALADDGYDVTLLGADTFDVGALAERLSLDLSDCATRVVDPDPLAVTEASADYDLFVNGSYLSSARNAAERGIYVVHFPGTRPASVRLRRLGALLPLGSVPGVVSFTWGDGFHMPDPGAGGAAWTSSKAEVEVSVDEDALQLQLMFGHLRPPAAGAADVTITVDGVRAAEVSVPTVSGGALGRLRARSGTAATVTIPGPGTVRVGIECDAFVPADLGLSTDARELGVPLRGISAGSRGSRLLAMAAPGLFHGLTASRRPGALSSYDVVASNSAFTRGFVEDWWDLESSPVLYPPVRLRAPSDSKTHRIVAVGRFFDSESGHSKKQVEMVRAFRRLRARGVDDWTLTFVGGCDTAALPYLDRVRREADGLPVDFLVDASGADRDAAIADASLFWHATGLGEDATNHPELMEHFGISTVEAMSTGAVPIVYAGGGQLEIVEPGISGFHFRSIDELVGHSHRLIRDPELRSTLSTGAVRRAAAFGFEPFRVRLREILEMAEHDRNTSPQ